MSGAQIKSDIWRWVKHYSYGCFAKSWNAAIAAVYGIVGIGAGSAVMPQQIQTPNWEMAISIFLTTFSITVIGYFKDNPLPANLGSAPPFKQNAPL